MSLFHQFTILFFYIFFCSKYFTNANQQSGRIKHNDKTIIPRTQNATIKSFLGSKNKIMPHLYNSRKDIIPNIQITDSYIRGHTPLMPMLDDAQKRTTLKEKEMNFYGSMISDRSLPTSKGSHLKEEEKKGLKHDDSSSKPYGR